MDASIVDPENFESLLKLALEAVQGRNWVLLAGIALIVAVAVARKLFGSRVPFLQTDAGGAVTVLVLSFLGAGVSALAQGQTLDGQLILEAFKVAFVAAGGFNLVKKLLPAVVALVGKKSAPPSVEPPKPIEVQTLGQNASDVDATMRHAGYVKLVDGRWKDRRLLQPTDVLAPG